MKTKVILFDLDGTLLPMEQEPFAKAYIKGLAETAAAAGYNPTEFANAVINGTAAMINNNGEKTNEYVFWNTIANTFGESVYDNCHMFDEFYAADFQKIKEICGFEPEAAKLIKTVKENGLSTVLATNPLFPKAATQSRIRWAGLSPDDFELYTTYENSSYCKPNLNYYKSIIEQLKICPEECLMIGNDVNEDMVASQLGMKVFLLTDYLINKNNADISSYPHGNINSLFAFLSNL